MGVFACPESATTLAALKKLLASGEADPGERIVAMITGAGIKSVDNFQPVDLPTISANDVSPE